MSAEEFQFGKPISGWKTGDAQVITFIVTEDCNLRCKYCYITHKASNKKMSLDTAKKFIDYMFSEKIKKQDAVIIEFIGGEPLLEIDLIDKITDYYKIKSFMMDDKWAWNYRISICTNGVNYSDEKVQDYINKNLGKLSLGITLDGTKEKHDLNRVFTNGQGSYDIIVKSIPEWLKHFVPGTKVTFASDDLKYLKDSILNLYNLGITEISANVVYENAWKDGDDKIFEQELIDLADYVIDNELYDKFKCSLFDETIGGYYNLEEKQRTFCGAGKMIAVGPDGKLFPCIRYKDYSLNNKKEWSIGDIENGIDMEKVRPFMTAISLLQSDDECLNCEVAGGCGFCQGFNYDDAETATNFSRAKYICKMHKARVRANDYYFSRLSNEIGKEKGIIGHEKKKMYFILDSNYTSFCNMVNPNLVEKEVMGKDILEKGLIYAREHFLSPVFIHSSKKFDFNEFDFLKKYTVEHIISAKFYNESSNLKNRLLVFNEDDVYLPINDLKNSILLIDETRLNKLDDVINVLIKKVDRINIVIQNLSRKFNLSIYQRELDKIKITLISENKISNKNKQLNILTDNLFLDTHNNCKAGDRTITLAPNGCLYICPLYYSCEKSSIGSLDTGLSEFKNSHLYKMENSPLCRGCKNYQCMNCIYLNENTTREVNVSPSFQCKKASLEKKISGELVNETNNYVVSNFEEPKTLDPINDFFEETRAILGYYKTENE